MIACRIKHLVRYSLAPYILLKGPHRRRSAQCWPVSACAEAALSAKGVPQTKIRRRPPIANAAQRHENNKKDRRDRRSRYPALLPY